MKALKVVIVIVLVLIGILAIIGITHKKEMSVSRSIEINAPHEVVWKHVSSLEMQNEWSPWTKIDPEMQSEYRGESGNVGSAYHWSSENESVGEGEQEIMVIEPMSHIEQDLRFIKPYESSAHVHINVNEGAEGAMTAEWGFKSEFNFMSSIMDVFMDMEEMIGADFDKGLKELKEICETEAAEMAANPARGGETFTVDGFEIKEMETMACTYVGVRQTVEMTKISAFFSENLPKIMEALQNAGYEPAGVPSALYFDWDEEAGTSDMAAVIPMGDVAVDLPGFESFSMPQGPSYQMDYMGNYENMGPAHEAIHKAMAERGVATANAVIEEYLTDRSTEPNPEKWHTKITYPIAPIDMDAMEE